VPGRVRETWAVTPSNRSCSVSRKPVFIESAITSVATPAATPIMEKSVTNRRTAGRYGDRRYRCATNHSKRIGGRPTGAEICDGSRQCERKSGEKKKIQDGMAGVGRIVIADHRKNLSALAVEAKTAQIFWCVLRVWNPPVEQMNDSPQRQQGSPNPHRDTTHSCKRPGDPY